MKQINIALPKGRLGEKIYKMLQKELEELLVNNKWDEAILYIGTIDRRLNDEELSTLAWCYSRSGKYEKAIDVIISNVKYK